MLRDPRDLSPDDISPGLAGRSGEALGPDRLPVFTNVEIADFLQSGFWKPRAFNLGTEGPSHNDGVLHYNVGHLHSAGQRLAEQALALYGEVLDLRFERTASEDFRKVDIYFDDAGSGASTSMITEKRTTENANVSVGNGWIANYGAGINTYSFQTYLHEIGHALGLGHAGRYNGDADYVTEASLSGRGTNHYLNDSWQTTVMSYFSQQENTATKSSLAFVISPMAADWIALTRTYGLGHAFAGDTTWGFNTTIETTVFAELSTYADVCAFTILDAGGEDTLDFSGYDARQRIDLAPEAVSSVGGLIGNMVIAKGTWIENAVGGSDADRMFATGADNELTGGAGADFLMLRDGDDTGRGGVGDDSLLGGAGDDLLSGVIGQDLLSGGEGRDTVLGGAGQDTILGGPGNDVIDGGTGADTIAGGPGHDRFVFATPASSAPDGRDLLVPGPDGRAAFDGPGSDPGDRFDLRGLGPLDWGGTGARSVHLTDAGALTACCVNLDKDPAWEIVIRIVDGVRIEASDYGAADFLLA